MFVSVTNWDASRISRSSGECIYKYVCKPSHIPGCRIVSTGKGWVKEKEEDPSVPRWGCRWHGDISRAGAGSGEAQLRCLCASSQEWCAAQGAPASQVISWAVLGRFFSFKLVLVVLWTIWNCWHLHHPVQSSQLKCAPCSALFASFDACSKDGEEVFPPSLSSCCLQTEFCHALCQSSLPWLPSLCLFHYSSFQSSPVPSAVLIPVISAFLKHSGCVGVPTISVLQSSCW